MVRVILCVARSLIGADFILDETVRLQLSGQGTLCGSRVSVDSNHNFPMQIVDRSQGCISHRKTFASAKLAYGYYQQRTKRQNVRASRVRPRFQELGLSADEAL